MSGGINNPVPVWYDCGGLCRRVVFRPRKSRPLKHLEVALAGKIFRIGWLLVPLLVLPLAAQEKVKDAPATPAIPQSALPPAGLCRVWLKDVAAGQQPAPTDCATAIRYRPPTAQVLFGDARGDAVPKSLERNGSSRGIDTLMRTPRATRRSAIPPMAGLRTLRSVDPTGARPSAGGSSGPVIRPTEPPPRVPEKPLEYPRS